MASRPQWPEDSLLVSPAGVVGRQLAAFSVHCSLGSRNARDQWGIWEVRPGLGVTDQGLMGLGRMWVEGEVRRSRGRADGGGGAKAEEAFREEALSKVGSERKAKGNQGAGHDECVSSARELFPRLGVVACATGRGRGCLGVGASPHRACVRGGGGGVWAVGRGVSQVGQLRPRGQSYAPASVVWRDTD